MNKLDATAETNNYRENESNKKERKKEKTLLLCGATQRNALMK